MALVLWTFCCILPSSLISTLHYYRFLLFQSKFYPCSYGPFYSTNLHLTVELNYVPAYQSPYKLYQLHFLNCSLRLTTLKRKLKGSPRSIVTSRKGKVCSLFKATFNLMRNIHHSLVTDLHLTVYCIDGFQQRSMI